MKVSVAAQWAALENHFRHHATLVGRFRHVGPDAVVHMLNSQRNEHGGCLSPGEREALIERDGAIAGGDLLRQEAKPGAEVATLGEGITGSDGGSFAKVVEAAYGVSAVTNKWTSFWDRAHVGRSRASNVQCQVRKLASSLSQSRKSEGHSRCPSCGLLPASGYCTT